MTDQVSRFAGEKILIADDEEVIVELAALLLKKRGFEVLTAYNGQECLSVTAEHRPALVLLDYMMPVMNGLEALRQIRARFPETYVVMFTGKGNEEVAVEIMKAGAADYLQKPFAKHSLQERIDSVLTVRSIELENRALLAERSDLQQEIKEWNFELEQRVKQKTLELEQAHRDIVQAERLAALGHISAGMAHEIRNPLNSINLYAELLRAENNLSADQVGYVDNISEEVERIDAILRKMLASSESPPSQLQKISLKKVIQKVMTDHQPRIVAQEVEVDLQLGDDIPCIKADEDEIEQVFGNLVSNALFEMPHGGRLGISLSTDSEMITVMVSDSGSGIPDENLSRIFDPFFTTKDKGTGFGLSVVLRIVKNCGGRIHAVENSEQGACFKIEFPIFPQSIH